MDYRRGKNDLNMASPCVYFCRRMDKVWFKASKADDLNYVFELQAPGVKYHRDMAVYVMAKRLPNDVVQLRVIADSAEFPHLKNNQMKLLWPRNLGGNSSLDLKLQYHPKRFYN